MARHMQRQGHKCGRHRVRRLMCLMRLVPTYREPNTSKNHPQQTYYKAERPHSTHGILTPDEAYDSKTEPMGLAA